jgi:hypothetical protein
MHDSIFPYFDILALLMKNMASGIGGFGGTWNDIGCSGGFPSSEWSSLAISFPLLAWFMICRDM